MDHSNEPAQIVIRVIFPAWRGVRNENITEIMIRFSDNFRISVSISHPYCLPALLTPLSLKSEMN